MISWRRNKRPIIATFYADNDTVIAVYCCLLTHLNLPKDAARVPVKVIAQRNVLDSWAHVEEGLHVLEEPRLKPSTDDVQLKGATVR